MVLTFFNTPESLCGTKYTEELCVYHILQISFNCQGSYTFHNMFKQ